MDPHPFLCIITVTIVIIPIKISSRFAFKPLQWHPPKWSVYHHSHQISHHRSHHKSHKNYLRNSILKGWPSPRMRIVSTKLLPAGRLACWGQYLEMLNMRVRITILRIKTWVPEAITVISDLTKVNLSWKKKKPLWLNISIDIFKPHLQPLPLNIVQHLTVCPLACSFRKCGH